MRTEKLFQATDMSLAAYTAIQNVPLVGELPTYHSDSSVQGELRKLYGVDIVDAKEAERIGIPLLIPRGHLFGTQTQSEYDLQRRKAIETALNEDGFQFLLAHPLIVCAIPTNADTTLATIDGNHRLRYSGKFYIRALPSIILTVDQLTKLINDGRDNCPLVDEEQIKRSVLRDVARAEHSFDSMPPEKKPTVVPDITGIDELKQKFPIFTSNPFDTR